MKRFTILLIITFSVNFFAIAGNDTDTKPQYREGKNYVIDGTRYKFLGYDLEGNPQFQGVKMPRMKKVKSNPQFNSKTRKLTKRKFH